MAIRAAPTFPHFHFIQDLRRTGAMDAFLVGAELGGAEGDADLLNELSGGVVADELAGARQKRKRAGMWARDPSRNVTPHLSRSYSCVWLTDPHEHTTSSSKSGGTTANAASSDGAEDLEGAAHRAALVHKHAHTRTRTHGTCTQIRTCARMKCAHAHPHAPRFSTPCFACRT